MILNYFLIFVNFVTFSTGLRIDAETGDEFQEEVGLQGRGLSGRYSSDQRTMKYQKDKEGQLKKVYSTIKSSPKWTVEAQIGRSLVKLNGNFVDST